MIMRKKIYIVSINLEIDIPNSPLMKFSYWLLAKSGISLDKVRKYFATYCVRYNCMKL